MLDARDRTTCYGKQQLKSHFRFSWSPQHITNLVFKSDLCPQGVVGVPLLCEGQSMLCPFVLGLQGPRDLAGLSVGRACAGELLQMTVFDLKLK